MCKSHGMNKKSCPFSRKNCIRGHFCFGNKSLLICKDVKRYDCSDQEILQENKKIQKACRYVLHHRLHLGKQSVRQIFLKSTGLLIDLIDHIRIQLPSFFNNGIQPVFYYIHIMRKTVDDIHNASDQLRKDHHDKGINHQKHKKYR